MKQILHNFKSNSSYQIRVLLVTGLFLMFTSFASAQTTAIPDPNFEQALLDYLPTPIDSDGVVNGQAVITNINAVTSLNLQNKNISNLTGIEAFTALQSLELKNNLLSGSLNLSMLTALTYLEVWQNQLTSLSVDPIGLTYLDCDENQFTSLDVSAMTSLVTFYFSKNNLLTTVDVSGLTNLDTFICQFDPLLSIVDVRGAKLSQFFYCDLSPKLSSILVTTVNPNPSVWKKDSGATYCTSLTTWNGAWSPITPTASSAAIIEANYSVADNITAGTLTIKNNAAVTIPTNFNVNLNGSLTVEPGSTFTLSNNANLVQTNINSTNSGAINVNRNGSSLFRLDYTLWSSPVSGTQTLGGFSPLTTTGRFYTYNSGTNQYNVAAPSTILSPTAPFSQARSYLIRMPNEGSANYNAGTETLSYNGVFIGTPNNGTVSVTGLTPDTYNAVGNPYPSTLDAALFLSGNNTDGVLYFWRKTNGIVNTNSAYATWTTFGAAGSINAPNNIAPDGTIAVGQGFIVKNVTVNTLNFTNAMRTSSNSALFFKTSKLAVKSRVWLNLTNASGVFSQALVGFVDGATIGVDNGIDAKYINDSPIALTSNINSEEYTIQGRPAFNASDVIALNFKTDVAGDYTIAIDHVDGLFSGSQDIYLVDSKTGTETNLKTSSYTFTAAAVVDNTRFSLKFQKTLSLDAQAFNDNSVIVYKNGGVIYVNSGAKMMNNVKVFDIQGRVVAERNNVKANTTSIQNLKASNQVLIVKVTTDDNQVISKKVEN
jgi:hypothetical protein